MRKSLKIGGIIVAFLATLSSGFVLGNFYRIFDFLCPAAASPYVLENDFVSEEGIIFPAGTVVPLRQCAYMQRFEWDFTIDNTVKLSPVKSHEGNAYGFSELHEKQE